MNEIYTSFIHFTSMHVQKF